MTAVLHTFQGCITCIILMAGFLALCPGALAQDINETDSVDQVDSNTESTGTAETLMQSGKYEVNLSIEAPPSLTEIGDFYNFYQNNFELKYDSILEVLPEQSVTARAHINTRFIRREDFRISPQDMPWLLEFSSHIYSSFKPVRALILFGL